MIWNRPQFTVSIAQNPSLRNASDRLTIPLWTLIEDRIKGIDTYYGGDSSGSSIGLGEKWKLVPSTTTGGNQVLSLLYRPTPGSPDQVVYVFQA